MAFAPLPFAGSPSARESPAGTAPHVKIRADIGTATGEKTSLVWGVIPGMTDEKIVINAHRDGYYEAALKLLNEPEAKQDA